MPTETTPARKYGLFDWTIFVSFMVIMAYGALLTSTDPDRAFAILFVGFLGVVVGRLLK